jgi:farnesyl-diphosphate farnesyltransferase
MESSARGLLGDLLRQVSRSFYLTLRVLPGPVRGQIGLAYLLARATDTIADTDVIPVGERLEALDVLRSAILDPTPGGAGLARRFTRLAGNQALPAERVLLERIDEALLLLRSFAAEDQQKMREVLAVITSGQELDLKRFGAAAEGRILSLCSNAELDDYTYRVAGCVGEFWTKICHAHLFPKAGIESAWLLAHSVRFGKGLQLVNILRDLPQDLRKGRCYLPEPQLAEHSLKPADLLHATSMPRFRHCYDEYLSLADGHLAAGWTYTNSLPWNQLRVRLACSWPLLIGIRTVERLRVGNILDAGTRIKATRGEVRWLMLKSLLLYPFPGAWHALFEEARAG